MIAKPHRLQGKVTIPASKSQTIRAYLIAAFARGISHIAHPLFSDDTSSAMEAIKAMGCSVQVDEDESVTIDSTYAFSDLDELRIDCGNSGTTEYLAIPMLTSIGIPVHIDGDQQLRKRPAKPLLDALEDLGAEVESEGGFPPFSLRGPLDGGETTIECRTSQYLSGLLLGAPLAQCDTHIKCSLLYEKPYVSMTLKWLDKEGIRYRISDDLEEAWIEGGQSYSPLDTYIEGDFSSASFFFVAAAIHGTTITVEGLDKDSVQGDKAILDILEKMGCRVEWNGMSVSVTGPEKLKGGEFDLNAIPDTLPALSVAAAFAEGDTILGNVPQARIKETDRIKVMHENLALLGVDVDEMEDGMVIHGKGHVKGNKVKGWGDHRVIMSLAVLATKAEGETEIDDISASSVTFPSFFTLLKSLEA
ncbi:MAG: 3-phosphoshikimate 1-carboxyvinyltransferase [Candidatus Ornithospirochaeta sp.]